MPTNTGAMKSQRKALGFWTATSLVTGNMIGSGIFLLPASLAVFGGISVVGWLCSAVGSILLALVFAGLARQALDRTLDDVRDELA